MNRPVPHLPAVLAALLLMLACSGPAHAAESYVYDANGRLLQVRHDDGTLIRYSYDLRGNVTRVFRGALQFGLDVDGDGVNRALSDGLLLQRYLSGFRGEALTGRALAANATQRIPALIVDQLDEARATALDVDGDDRAERLSDGLLLLRHLFGFGGSALVGGAVAGPRPLEQIEQHLGDL